MKYHQRLPNKPKIHKQNKVNKNYNVQNIYNNTPAKNLEKSNKDFIVLNIYNTPEKNLAKANLDMTNTNQTNANLNVENNYNSLITDDSLSKKIQSNGNLRDPYPLSEYRSPNQAPPPLPYKNKFSKSLNPYWNNQNYNVNNNLNQIKKIDNKPINEENKDKIVTIVENNHIYIVENNKNIKRILKKRQCICIILFLINPVIGLIYYFLFCR